MQILDNAALIQPGVFMRPLALLVGGDSVSTTDTYSGRPINNLLWVPVEAVLGPVWMGRHIFEYVELKTEYNEHDGTYYDVDSHEFAVDVPPRHQLRGAW